MDEVLTTEEIAEMLPGSLGLQDDARSRLLCILGILMGFTDAVHTTGVEQNTFRGGRLAGVDVRHDTNVAHPLKGMTARHMVCSFQQRCSGIGRIKRSCGGSRLAHYQR